MLCENFHKPDQGGGECCGIAYLEAFADLLYDKLQQQIYINIDELQPVKEKESLPHFATF